jgi:tetratricopeptide (TPR) repeat protein
VTQGETASTQLTLDLQPGVPYTVEICALFQDLRQGCTTDPGWASGTDVAFYYVPDPQLGTHSLQTLEQDIISVLGEDTPESLYAQAVLLSQNLAPYDIGLYHEAIDLLNRVLTEYPDSPLALAPEAFVRLGNLYGEADLSLSAARAFHRATELGTPCTEATAQAYLGLALTTPDGSAMSDLLNQALDEYHCLLKPAAFATQYADLCEVVGDSCTDFRPVQAFEGQG